jgi:hypothetical protein
MPSSAIFHSCIPMKCLVSACLTSRKRQRAGTDSSVGVLQDMSEQEQYLLRIVRTGSRNFVWEICRQYDLDLVVRKSTATFPTRTEALLDSVRAAISLDYRFTVDIEGQPRDQVEDQPTWHDITRSSNSSPQDSAPASTTTSNRTSHEQGRRDRSTAPAVHAAPRS